MTLTQVSHPMHAPSQWTLTIPPTQLMTTTSPNHHHIHCPLTPLDPNVRHLCILESYLLTQISHLLHAPLIAISQHLRLPPTKMQLLLLAVYNRNYTHAVHLTLAGVAMELVLVYLRRRACPTCARIRTNSILEMSERLPTSLPEDSQQVLTYPVPNLKMDFQYLPPVSD